ncbi:hypothetical protein S40288_02851 [Stachybotrys chartarum IBT 40288]|nr:hypothetical protein S40288_02851 [Stachybotrys chartarum IBT 40288]
MAEVTTLEALQIFHRELLAVREGRADAVAVLDNELLTSLFEGELARLWNRPQRSEGSRAVVKSGMMVFRKVVFDGTEFKINEVFQQSALTLADEIELDEQEAARLLLDSQEDTSLLGRPLLECGIIRFHQQRKYALDSLRLLADFANLEDDLEESGALEPIKAYLSARIFTSGSSRLIPRCMSAISSIRSWLQKIGDKLAAAQALGQYGSGGVAGELETIEFSRVSLVQQHELLGVILCRSIEQRQATTSDFVDFISFLKKVDRYDALLIHLIPAVGAYISIFGSTEGGYDLMQARELNSKLFSFSDESTWPLAYLHAAVKAWWLAEYSGFYLDDPPESSIPPNTDLDEGKLAEFATQRIFPLTQKPEDRQRSKQYLDALKDGAFDFLLSVSGDIRSTDWHDSVRTGMRKWLQRKSPALASDTIQFSDFFQSCLMVQLEVFVDAFISNLPDVLRKLRVEEDEQRQLSQAHEQDLDLERFLLIIAYSYEGRPDAAANFWSDPDSNLAGFMHWASRRASTPLVAAFCEMLAAISETDECATAAHEFLLDEGHHSSGKMRKSQSLTWTQIFKELDFFSDKIKQKPNPPNPGRYRGGKPTTDQAETEPESAMMLECYLRLVTKLTTESETTRQYMLQNQAFHVVEKLFELASRPVPSRLRGCIFTALRALMTRRTTQEGHVMWTYLENWITGGYAGSATSQHRQPQQSALVSMERILDEISIGFEEPESFIQLLLALISPSLDASPLNDALPFPENLGSAFLVPGIDVYADYVLGRVFATGASELQDVNQARVLRLTCLDFILTCLTTFNEDLIILANETSLPIDSIISATDLATYVRLHPFARVMEWMFNDKVMATLFQCVHQEPTEIGNSSPDSPLVLGILRAVEVMTKVLDLQATYLDLIRPHLKLKASQRRQPVGNAAYASFEEGLVTRLDLVVDLGSYCGLGHPELSLACLKLLERISSSPKITSVWSGPGRHAQRNKAIVAMEANGEHEAISRQFVSELMTPLDAGREAESPSYMIKMYMLDFLYQCLRESPKKPTIAHLLLGFKCNTDSLSIDVNGAFALRESLFHSLLRLLLETPSSDAQGMRLWLIALKSRAMRILHILWTSHLSASLVVEELRENEFIFHLLLRETVIQPDLPWEGQHVASKDFLLTDGAATLLDFLNMRSLAFSYIGMELCMVSQNRMPSVKRRIYEALNGQLLGDSNEPISTPTVFDLYDFLLPDGAWSVPPPDLQFYRDLDLSACVEKDGESNDEYNLERVKDVLLLRKSEHSNTGTLAAAQDLAAIDREEASILEYLVAHNRQGQVMRQDLKVLQTWTRLLLVMVESSDFKGAAQTSFFLQALQAILPSLEAFASDRPSEALELAKLAKILLFKLDLTASSAEKASPAIGHLIGDKLFQLFHMCLQAIGKWAGPFSLRCVYYEICYWYLTAISGQGPLSSGRTKTSQAIHAYGERLINVICEDAQGGEYPCQTAAFILLNALINLGQQEHDEHVVETLNRINFIGILVDSLRNIMQDWHEAQTAGSTEKHNCHEALLSLLLQLAETRTGAKYILHANLFRTVEVSGLFTADPELQTSAENSRAAEHHYDLLAKVVRIIGAALISRGSHNVVQGRRFLTDHRMLVAHTLKRSVGIGSGPTDAALDARVGELADGLMVIMAATGFLEFENEISPETKQETHVLFH